VGITGSVGIIYTGKCGKRISCSPSYSKDICNKYSHEFFKGKVENVSEKVTLFYGGFL